MKLKNHHLKQRGRKWWLRYDIPSDVRHFYPDRGSRTVEESLKTNDVVVARALRNQRLRELDAEWANKRRDQGKKDRIHHEEDFAPRDTLEEQALYIRNFGSKQDVKVFTSNLGDEAEDIAIGLSGVSDFSMNRDLLLQEVRETPRGKELSSATDIALGRKVPIKVLSEEWLSMNPKRNSSTLYGHRKAFELLEEKFTCVEDVSHQDGRLFLRDLLKTRAKSTVNRYASAYRGLWDHVGRDTALWSMKGVEGEVDSVEVQPWTDEDYLQLLDAAANKLGRSNNARKVWLAIRIAAHTGASLSGISGMQIRTIEGLPSAFLPEKKTKHRSRVIPIHEAIVEDVQEWAEDPYKAKPLSQQFTRLKEGLGFGREKVFHSFRHSVVQKLENARVMDREIKRLLGHKLGTITFDTYNAPGLDYEVLADVVSKIRWPE